MFFLFKAIKEHHQNEINFRETYKKKKKKDPKKRNGINKKPLHISQTNHNNI